MGQSPLFPAVDRMPFEMVHVGAVIGRTVRCRVPFGYLNPDQVNAISCISISHPPGFSLQPFNEAFEQPVLLPDGSVVLGIRADEPMPPGEYVIKITMETARKNADIIPCMYLANAVVVHVYPEEFIRGVKSKKKPCRRQGTCRRSELN